MKVISYKVVTAIRSGELELKVNEMLMDGFQPFGGVAYMPLPAFGVTPYEFLLCQVMVQYGPDENE